jgi:hypothetical protein
MKIESEIEKYIDIYDHEEQSWIITITAKEQDDILFTFKPEYSGDAEEWKDMLTACEIADMNYNSSHGGDCQISINNKHVFFELSRHGDGLGGEIEIMIPKKLCIDAFKHIWLTMAKS